MASIQQSPIFNPGIAVFDSFSGCKFGDVSAVSVNSIATLLTPTTGTRLTLVGMSISLSADASLLLEDNSAGAANFVYRTPLLLAKTVYTIGLGQGRALSAINNVLKGTGSANAAVTGILFYLEA